MKWLSSFIKEHITEANDYKRTRQYNKLTPRMKRAVDMVFRAADKDADVIKNFEKNVNAAAKKVFDPNNFVMSIVGNQDSCATFISQFENIEFYERGEEIRASASNRWK